MKVVTLLLVEAECLLPSVARQAVELAVLAFLPRTKVVYFTADLFGPTPADVWEQWKSSVRYGGIVPAYFS